MVPCEFRIVFLGGRGSFCLFVVAVCLLFAISVETWKIFSLNNFLFSIYYVFTLTGTYGNKGTN